VALPLLIFHWLTAAPAAFAGPEALSDRLHEGCPLACRKMSETGKVASWASNVNLAEPWFINAVAPPFPRISFSQSSEENQERNTTAAGRQTYLAIRVAGSLPLDIALADDKTKISLGRNVALRQARARIEWLKVITLGSKTFVSG
jgi:hypothetical protein